MQPSLNIPIDTEISPGIFSLNQPKFDEETKEWYCLANVYGALAIVAVQPTVTIDDRKFNLVPKL